MNIGKLRLDPIAREEGVWVDFMDGGKVKLCSAHSRRYDESLKKHTEHFAPTLRIVGESGVSSKEQEKAFIQVLADCLGDWSGFEDEGVVVDYSREKAVEYLTEIEPFRLWITREISKIDNFKAAVKEERAKNS